MSSLNIDLLGYFNIPKVSGYKILKYYLVICDELIYTLPDPAVKKLNQDILL